MIFQVLIRLKIKMERRQKDYLKSKYPNHEIISDIGSGLLSILEQSDKGIIEELAGYESKDHTKFIFDKC